jgi:recombination protein RecT
MEEKKELSVLKNEISESVLNDVLEMQKLGRVSFPKNFNPENALKASFLVLEKTKDMSKQPALSVCSAISVKKALFDMLIQGLSVAKTQGYFIVRGKELCFDRSYFGSIAITKRIKGVVDVFAQAIFEGDKFSFRTEKARKVDIIHEQTLDTISNGVVIGAYCTIIYEDKNGKEKESSEVMSIKQIKQSWEKSPRHEKKIHAETPDEMAKRTVIARCCKIFINTTDDSDLKISDEVIGAFNRTDGREDHEKELANGDEIIDASEETIINNETGNIEPKHEVDEQENFKFPKRG